MLIKRSVLCPLCIAGNQSSALFVFPSHKLIMSPLYLIVETVVNPVWSTIVPLRGVNLGLVWLWVQVDRLDLPAPSCHMTGVWWELPLPPSLCNNGWPTLNESKAPEQFFSTLNRCHMDLWQLIGSYPSSPTSTSTSLFFILPRERLSKLLF